MGRVTHRHPGLWLSEAERAARGDAFLTKHGAGGSFVAGRNCMLGICTKLP